MPTLSSPSVFYDDIIALEVSVESSFVYIFGMVSRSSSVLKSHDLLGVKNKKTYYKRRRI